MHARGTTGLYHVRARDYDPHTGRFVSRDPAEPVPQEPESFHPYVFANSNPQIFSDPTGKFTLVGINMSLGIQNSLQGIRSVSLHLLKNYIKDKIGQAITRALLKAVVHLLPVPSTFSGVSIRGTRRPRIR